MIHSGGGVWERYNAMAEEEQNAILGEYVAIGDAPGVMAGHQLKPADTASTCD